MYITVTIVLHTYMYALLICKNLNPQIMAEIISAEHVGGSLHVHKDHNRTLPVYTLYIILEYFGVNLLGSLKDTCIAHVVEVQ